MAYRNIYLSKPSRLTIEQNNLRVIQEDLDISIPVEDIRTLLIEDRTTQISAYALGHLTMHDVFVFICDHTHLPCAAVMPFAAHTIQVKRLKNQISLTLPLKKQMWKKVVQAKVTNQALCLKYNHLDASDLEAFVKRVASGDGGYIEAQAARIYFARLFGAEFTRDADNLINSCLNYGYSIIRGLIARSLVSHGFEPSLGIHHHNELNNFNLADDMMEPIRPVVDLFVVKNIHHEYVASTLDIGLKGRLYDIINHTISYGNETHSVANAIDLMIESLVSTIDRNDAKLLAFPSLLELQKHSYE